MTSGGTERLLQIKKYPNRRYYDVTRSRHVTLQEVHDLVRDGFDVCITDAKTGDDITNLVLIQILVDKDQPKLDLFPSTIFHAMIRSNRQAIRSMIDRVFGPFMEMIATSQKQFDAYFRKATGGRIPTPMDWATRMMDTFAPGSTGSAAGNGTFESEFDGPSDQPGEPPEEGMEDLRRQMQELQDRINKLTESRPASEA